MEGVRMAKGKYHDWLTPDGLTKLQGWARDGLTDEQIADNMGIGTTTLYRWKDEYKDIRESLKRGKEVVDRHVENALLKRAMGYEYEEETYEKGMLAKVVKKQVAPDTTAQIFWLKNRKPNEWRDKREQSVTMNLHNLNDDEIDELLSDDE